eukprot:TRINITY_DN1442_c0_g1_i7.p1 TRINITY_DN1442_c0_g1~~TRINITY_DN1442_c0_g1_i7.p1  ORF type:complete len:204 (-),score=26.30 TRINITY_DN1442_c0_g1_i7:353-964(-)
MDIGVSSMQLGEISRGFSFKRETDAPLDMRMDQSADIPTAADIVNTYSEQKLAEILWRYADEKFARKIAYAIVTERALSPIVTTSQLAEIIRNILPQEKNKQTIDPCTRTFQALRVCVNQELQELATTLRVAERMLREGGRLVVISFQFKEDRIVKEYLSSCTRNSSSLQIPMKLFQSTATTTTTAFPFLTILVFASSQPPYR